MSNYLPKYSLKQATIKVGYPNGFYRVNPRTGKKDIHVKPHTRTQMVRDYTYSTKILEHQRVESDWSHQSGEYPNTFGLTDKEIHDFIKNTTEDKEVVKEYIKHIKCYDKDDIREVSKTAYAKFRDIMKEKYYHIEPFPDAKDPYNPDTTIFITSPRGGFDVLSDFGYANKLDKKNFPYDLEKSGYEYPTLKADSLPYGTNISDVNDVVFIDDIYMSGEQCDRGYNVLKNKLGNFDLPKNQIPRLHYMAMVGNKNASEGKYKGWDSFIVGEEFNFKREGKHFEEVSAIVFPFSIPDDDHHYTARRLYSNKKRFEHRKY